MVLARVMVKNPSNAAGGVATVPVIGTPQAAPTAVQTPFGIQKAFMVKGQRLR